MVKKGKFRKLILSILPAFALVGLLPTQQVEAAGIFGDHNRVFMGVLLDASRNSVYIDPIIDDGAMKEDDWVANSQITAEADKGQPVWYCGGTGENNGKCHYLSFPGSDYSKAKLYNQTDQDLADNVASVMTTSFSSLIQKCAMMDEDGNFTADEYYETVANIANARTNGDLVTNTFTIDCGGSTGHLEVAPAPDYTINSSGVNMGTTIQNFATVKAVGEGINDEKSDIQWSVPKGYSEGQYGYNEDVAGEFTNDVKQVQFISVAGVAQYGLNAKVNGYIADENGYDKLYDYTAVESWFSSILKMISNGVTKLLGLTKIEDLVFNRNINPAGTYFGTMPANWMSVGRIFYWISLIVAAFILMYGYIIALGKRSLANISPSVRASLKETLMNYLYVLLLELFFIPVFALAVRANWYIVDMFSSLVSSNASTFALGLTSGFRGAIAGIVLEFAFVAILITINIQYIMRSIMILIMFGSGPIFIASITIDSQKKMFTTWAKELFANIFLQSFNAFLLAALFMLSAGTQNRFSGVLLQIGMLYSFIPLNKWYMNTLWGVGEGSLRAMQTAGHSVELFNDKVAEGVRDTAIGAANGAIGYSTGYGNAMEADLRTQVHQGGTAKLSGSSGSFENNSTSVSTLKDTKEGKENIAKGIKPDIKRSKDLGPGHTGDKKADARYHRNRLGAAAIGAVTGAAGVPSWIVSSGVENWGENSYDGKGLYSRLQDQVDQVNSDKKTQLRQDFLNKGYDPESVEPVYKLKDGASGAESIINQEQYSKLSDESKSNYNQAWKIGVSHDLSEADRANAAKQISGQPGVQMSPDNNYVISDYASGIKDMPDLRSLSSKQAQENIKTEQRSTEKQAERQEKAAENVRRRDEYNMTRGFGPGEAREAYVLRGKEMEDQSYISKEKYEALPAEEKSHYDLRYERDVASNMSSEDQAFARRDVNNMPGHHMTEAGHYYSPSPEADKNLYQSAQKQRDYEQKEFQRQNREEQQQTQQKPPKGRRYRRKKPE